METDRNASPTAPRHRRRRPASIEVEISDNAVAPRRRTARPSKAWPAASWSAEGVEVASISIALVDDPTIRAINRRHLDHDWPTDVISFGLSEPGDSALSGELVVSAEMAADDRPRVGRRSRLAELALYVVHGLLHLCGLDDRDPADACRGHEAEGRGDPRGAKGWSTPFDPGPARRRPSGTRGGRLTRWPR